MSHVGAAAAMRMAEVETNFYGQLAKSEVVADVTDGAVWLDTSLKQVDVDDLLQRLSRGEVEYNPGHNSRCC